MKSPENLINRLVGENVIKTIIELIVCKGNPPANILTIEKTLGEDTDNIEKFIKLLPKEMQPEYKALAGTLKKFFEGALYEYEAKSMMLRS